MKIFLIILTALILRLINLNQSLWLDESINVYFTTKYSFLDFLTVYSLGDFHPPLYFAIIWLTTHFFGNSEIIVRLPSVIFGTATVYITYLIGKNLFNKKVATFASIILAINPLHIYYSQEARMYALAAFSAALSFYALIKLVNNARFAWLFYGITVALVLYSDYMVYFILPAQFVFIIWFYPKKILDFFKSQILAGIIFSPWLLIFPSQLSTGQSAASNIPGWAGVVGGANLKELLLVWVKIIIGRVTFVNKFFYAFIVSSISLLYLYLIFKAISKSKQVSLLIFWGIIPLILSFIVSLFIPILAYFRLIYLIPALALILGLGISKIKLQTPTLIILILINLVFVGIYYFNPKFQREDWKNAITFVNLKNDPVLFEDSNIPAPALYYNCQNCYAALLDFPAKSPDSVADIDTLLSSPEKILLFDYLVEISDPERQVLKQLNALGYKNTVTKNFEGVGFVYEFSK